MITFDFHYHKKSCYGCEALLHYHDGIYYCFLGYRITSCAPYYPLNPCSRPISPGNLLDVLNAFFLESDL